MGYELEVLVYIRVGVYEVVGLVSVGVEGE